MKISFENWMRGLLAAIKPGSGFRDGGFTKGSELLEGETPTQLTPLPPDVGAGSPKRELTFREMRELKVASQLRLAKLISSEFQNFTTATGMPVEGLEIRMVSDGRRSEISDLKIEIADL
jgi:hypothetical protein